METAFSWGLGNTKTRRVDQSSSILLPSAGAVAVSEPSTPAGQPIVFPPPDMENLLEAVSAAESQHSSHSSHSSDGEDDDDDNDDMPIDDVPTPGGQPPVLAIPMTPVTPLPLTLPAVLPPPPPPSSEQVDVLFDADADGEDEESSSSSEEDEEEEATPDTVLLSPSATTVVDLARISHELIRCETNFTSSVLREDNYHPYLESDQVLAILDSDAGAAIAVPFKKTAAAHVEHLSKHRTRLAIFRLNTDTLIKYIAEGQWMSSGPGTADCDQFPQLALLLKAALPSPKTLKDAGISKIEAFGSFLTATTLLSKLFAVIRFDDAHIESLVMAEIAKKSARVAAPTVSFAQKLGAARLKSKQAEAAAGGGGGGGTTITAVDKVTPSISPKQREEAIARETELFISTCETLFPQVTNVLAEYLGRVLDNQPVPDFAKRLIEELSSGDEGIQVSPEAMEALEATDPVGGQPTAKCWIPFDRFSPRQRAAVIIYIIVTIYTKLFHTKAHMATQPIKAFSPVALTRVISSLTDVAGGDLNPVVAMFVSSTPRTTAAAATAATSKAKLAAAAAVNNHGGAGAGKAPVDSKAKAAAAAKVTRKRKRSDEDEQNPAKATAADPIKVDSDSDETATATTAPPPAKRTKAAAAAASSAEKKKAATPRSSPSTVKTLKPGTPIDASYFKLSADGNEVVFAPSSDASKAVQEAITTEPQPTRSFIAARDAIVPATADPMASDCAFAVAIDQTGRPVLGAPRDFTLVFTNPTETNGDEDRYGSLQLAIIAFAGLGKTGAAAAAEEESDDEEEHQQQDGERDAMQIDDDEDEDAAEKSLKPSAEQLAMAKYDAKYYKPIYTTRGTNPFVTTEQYRAWWNRVIRTLAITQLPEATTLEISIEKIAKFNRTIFNKQGNYNGALAVYSHTAKVVGSKDNQPRVFFPNARTLTNGKGASYEHLQDYDGLVELMKPVLRASVRAYTPRVDPSNGASHHSDVGAHGPKKDGIPNTYYAENGTETVATQLVSSTESYAAKKFAGCCIGCSAPGHMDDYLISGKIPAFPLIRCAGCGPAYRKFGRSKSKGRNLGLCPNH
jgi:hypothetical protein